MSRLTALTIGVVLALAVVGVTGHDANAPVEVPKLAQKPRVVAKPSKEPSRKHAASENDSTRSVRMRVTVTAYSPGDPKQGTGWRTATGRHAKYPGVAVDPRRIKLGSRVYIPGYGWRIADDTGGAIKGARIDLRLMSRGECFKFGRRVMWVRVEASR